MARDEITQDSVEAEKRRQQRRSNWRFGLYCGLLSLLILEAVIRWKLPEKTPVYLPSENPRLVYELNPAIRGVNALGIRGPEFDRSSNREGYLVAMIGDSHTFSAEVRQYDGTIPARVEHHLRSADLPGPMRVLNFGVPGYNSAQQLELLQSTVMPLSPDFVVLQYTINDSHVCNYVQPRLPALNWLVHRSALLVYAVKQLLYSELGREHLYPFVARHLPDLLLYREGLVGTARVHEDDDPRRLGHPPRSPDLVPERYHYMIGDAHWRESIAAFGRAVHDAGIPLLATGFVEASERSTFEAAGFDVLSFGEIFEGRDMLAEGGYDPANTTDHFDARGSEIIATALATRIAELAAERSAFE